MNGREGRVEQAIVELFAANPDRAFVTTELIEHCFPGTTHATGEKHRGSVLRAAANVIARDPNWVKRCVQGQRACFVNMDSVRSYALGRLITRNVIYKSIIKSRLPRYEEWDYDVLVTLLEHEYCQANMAPGGAWHRHVEMHRAERDGNHKRLAKLKAQESARFSQILTIFQRWDNVA